MRLSANPRLLGPKASAFHSAASKSSIETKVGSPPAVRRTSPALRSVSTRLPSPSSASQASSEKGSEMRGASATRETSIVCWKVISQGSRAPLIGAAAR